MRIRHQEGYLKERVDEHDWEQKDGGLIRIQRHHPDGWVPQNGIAATLRRGPYPRSPNIAVPTRTISAPSSMATAKSSDIPMLRRIV